MQYKFKRYIMILRSLLFSIGIILSSNISASFNTSIIASVGGVNDMYTISGIISGLSETAVLQINGSDNFSISVDGSFSFATKQVSGITYAVSVLSAPSGQKCAVFNGLGQVSADVNDIIVNCSIDDANVFITQNAVYYAQVDATASSINISKGMAGEALNTFAQWVNIGPHSGFIKSIVEQGVFLFIADQYTLYKTSRLNNNLPWDTARRVWSVSNTDQVISQLASNGNDLTVHYVENLQTTELKLNPSNYAYEGCNGSKPVDYNYVAGTSSKGTGDYIEYIPGTLPIILSSPHGGYLEPEDIPIFDPSTVTNDAKSQEYTLLAADYLYTLTGERPHVIVNHVKRNRLNLNRARGVDNSDNIHDDNADSDAQLAWDEFHAYIEDAKSWVTSVCGKGIFFDLHTLGGDDRISEVAFALDKDQLSKTLPEIEALADQSSLKNLIQRPGLTLFPATFGRFSVGDLLHTKHNKTKIIPNATLNINQGDYLKDYHYFNGGHNVRKHGSKEVGLIDGLQVESHYKFVNFGPNNRADYSEKLAKSMLEFTERWYGFLLATNIDVDSDGVIDSLDNCPVDANADQADIDNDGIGNSCDPVDNTDTDSDGVIDSMDNCPEDANANQADIDNDGIGNACDSVDNTDTDGDGVIDSMDNCQFVSNPAQADANTNNIGNACDNSDTDNDDLSDQEEFQLGTDPNNRDTDNDGILDSVDPEPLVKANDEVCFPIQTPDLKIVMICF